MTHILSLSLNCDKFEQSIINESELYAIHTCAIWRHCFLFLSLLTEVNHNIRPFLPKVISSVESSRILDVYSLYISKCHKEIFLKRKIFTILIKDKFFTNSRNFKMKFQVLFYL